MLDIAVIGCGVIGLTSALAIQKKLKNVSVTIFTKDMTPNTTSDIAAGLWAPYLLQGTSQDKILKWSAATYEYLLALWREGKADEAGICLLPSTHVVENENYKCPDWLKPTLSYTELTEEQLLKLGERYKIKFKGGFVFNTFTWEGSTFLPYLQKEFLKNGGSIKRKKIFHLKELLNYDLVVNCTGLGSKTLLNDKLMTPIRGQIIKVEAPWIFHSYVIDSDKSGYIIANKNLTILGGTKQLDTSKKFDPNDAKKIMRNCSDISPSIISAKVVKHQVGLRPGRERIRVESEVVDVGNKQLIVVHNYGHGGSGITLSIGCAKEVVDLVEDGLKNIIKHKL